MFGAIYAAYMHYYLIASFCVAVSSFSVVLSYSIIQCCSYSRRSNCVRSATDSTDGTFCFYCVASFQKAMCLYR